MHTQRDTEIKTEEEFIELITPQAARLQAELKSEDSADVKIPILTPDSLKLDEMPLLRSFEETLFQNKANFELTVSSVGTSSALVGIAASLFVVYEAFSDGDFTDVNTEQKYGLMFAFIFTALSLMINLSTSCLPNKTAKFLSQNDLNKMSYEPDEKENIEHWNVNKTSNFLRTTIIGNGKYLWHDLKYDKLHDIFPRLSQILLKLEKRLEIADHVAQFLAYNSLVHPMFSGCAMIAMVEVTGSPYIQLLNAVPSGLAMGFISYDLSCLIKFMSQHMQVSTYLSKEEVTFLSRIIKDVDMTKLSAQALLQKISHPNMAKYKLAKIPDTARSSEDAFDKEFDSGLTDYPPMVLRTLKM